MDLFMQKRLFPDVEEKRKKKKIRIYSTNTTLHLM